LFAAPTIGQAEDGLPGTPALIDRSPGLARAVAELVFGSQSATTLGEARAWLRARRGLRGEHIFDLLMERVSPRTAVEKSPEHALSDAALVRIAAAYPHARFLHLTRHPLTTQASMRRYLRASESQAMAWCLFSWYEINFRLVALGERSPPERYLRVRAEDLLNDSRPNLVRIATWLRLPTDEASVDAMLHPERSPFARLVPGVARGGGGEDAEFLRDPQPHGVELPPGLDQPPHWSGPPALWSAVVELARKLGYPSD
jgi:hypothetical protein